MTNTEQYLKRETTGLHTPAVTEIKNLAEYRGPANQMT